MNKGSQVVVVANKDTNSSLINLGQDELFLRIAKFLPLADLLHLALVNSRFTLLLFNQDRSVKKKKQPLMHTKPLVSDNLPPMYKAEEGISFEHVQQVLWKPLVCYFFPNFNQTLNIRNWMHVLRRRVAHLKLYSPTSIPLRKNIPNEVFEEKGNELLEGCEWIYKCPLSFNQLQVTVSSDVRFCNVCKKNVYNVKSRTELLYRIEQEDCVALNSQSSGLTRSMGSIAPPRQNLKLYKLKPKTK